MSDWKTAYRSFYYDTAEAPDDIQLDADRTALLVIDIQNTYLEVADDAHEAERWAPFRERMNNTVIPNTAKLIDARRARGVEVIFARIACLTSDGRDRSLSQKKPGFNYLLLPKDRADSQLVPELTPAQNRQSQKPANSSSKPATCGPPINMPELMASLSMGKTSCSICLY